mgnify:CR=1 FL=1
MENSPLLAARYPGMILHDLMAWDPAVWAVVIGVLIFGRYMQHVNKRSGSL